MAYRKRAVARRTSAPKRRVTRRRGLAAAMSTASVKSAINTTLYGALGGAAAAILTNVIGDNLGGFKNYTGIVGAVATQVFLKQPVIAAGMAGYAGAKVARELTGLDLLADNGYLPNGSSMFLQGYETPGLADGMYTGSNIYASNYTLAGYGVPGL